MARDSDDLDLCVLTVHAHPDDEASKGASTIARYRSEGVRTVLVCCTGGEEGDILNPEMDRPEVRDNLHEVRMAELDQAAAIIGYEHVELLGYRDSGMPDADANAHQDSFAMADLDEAIGRLVAIIRRTRPQVIVTYPDDQQGYRHPDHLRVHDISRPAFDLAADASAYPEVGEPWQPLKLYYSMWSRGRVEAMHDMYLHLGLDSPYDEGWFKRPSLDHRITTRIDIQAHYDVREKALLAHRTQVDPTSRFWFGLPTEHAAAAYPWDDYILAHSLVPVDTPEDDLFAGLR